MTSNDIKKSASDAADYVQRSADDLKSRASDVADDVSDKASGLYGQAKEALGNASERLPSASEAMDTARGGSQQILRQVAKQPIEALLLAGAIGYLVGWAANRG